MTPARPVIKAAVPPHNKRAQPDGFLLPFVFKRQKKFATASKIFFSGRSRSFRGILGVNFPCGKINTRRKFTPEALYEPGLLIPSKSPNSPHSQPVEIKAFIQKIASRSTCDRRLYGL
jgi:hypothetical protein